MSIADELADVVLHSLKDSASFNVFYHQQILCRHTATYDQLTDNFLAALLVGQSHGVLKPPYHIRNSSQSGIACSKTEVRAIMFIRGNSR